MHCRFCIICLLLVPHIARADIYECNGTWSNTPCQNPGKVIVEKPSDPRQDEKASTLSRKKSLFHDLNMKHIKAERDHGIIFDISATEAACNKEDVSIEECQTLVQQAHEALDARMSDQELTELQKKNLELELEKQQAATGDSNQQIIIQNNYPTWPTPTPEYGWPGDGAEENPQPGNPFEIPRGKPGLYKKR